MTIDLDDDILIYMLGYLNAAQWVDALSYEGLDKDDICKLLNIVDKKYKGLKAEVDDLIKENIVNRLSK